MVNSNITMTVTDVAHVGRISNIHINAASAKIATVLCSMIERIGVPLGVTPKNDLGTNQKKKKYGNGKKKHDELLYRKSRSWFNCFS